MEAFQCSRRPASSGPRRRRLPRIGDVHCPVTRWHGAVSTKRLKQVNLHRKALEVLIKSTKSRAHWMPCLRRAKTQSTMQSHGATEDNMLPTDKRSKRASNGEILTSPRCNGRSWTNISIGAWNHLSARCARLLPPGRPPLLSPCTAAAAALRAPGHPPCAPTGRHRSRTPMRWCRWGEEGRRRRPCPRPR